MGADTVKCINCGCEYNKEELERMCSNCFCCTGCEIYSCPKCNDDIVIRPIGNPPQYHYNKE